MKSLIMLMMSLPMLISQSLMLALSQIWANKMRAVLTMTGIVIGVSSVVAVIAALTGLKTNVLNEFESLGTNKIFISPDRPDHGPKRHASWRQVIRFWPHQLEGMQDHCPSIAAFTRVGSWSENVSFREKTLENVGVTGIDASWHEIENRGILLGRPFSIVDEQNARQVCLITEDMRDNLMLDRDCIGDYILVGNRSYQIVGLVENAVESSMFSGGQRQEDMYIPFTTLWKQREPFFHVVATSKSTEVAEEARAEIRFFLRRTRNLAPDEPDTFEVAVIERFLEQFDSMSKMVTFVAAGIVGISLLVGGVGIMNIMLVSVSERTREIGLRKAVGAKPSAILLQFLVEAIMLCFIGGSIGVGLGQIFTFGLASIPGAEMHNASIPIWAIAMAFAFAASVGVIFGMFPAIKAAKLDPIDALRHE